MLAINPGQSNCPGFFISNDPTHQKGFDFWRPGVKIQRLGTRKSPKYLRHREAAGRGDPSSQKRSHGLPRYARNDKSE